jgi:hypothetical protein
MDGGVEVEYPVGRFVLRSYKDGKKVYTPVNNNPHNKALYFGCSG